MTKIPKSLQPILWSKEVESLDINKDKTYIIHQVLRYGSLENLKWLFKTYPYEEIKSEFIQNPSPIYTPPSLNFAKKILLNIKGKINEQRYLKSFA